MRQVYLVTGIIAAALIGCSSEPPKPPEQAAAPIAKTLPPAIPSPVPQETDAQKMNRLVGALSGKSVYFDYDNFTIKPEFKAGIEAHANVLKSIPKANVMIEGNADERGSTEYNLALGQKRAEAVGKAVRLLGVDARRIEVVSFGKEKPRATCHEEKCWAENRRVDFSYKLEK